jgi:transposase
VLRLDLVEDPAILRAAATLLEQENRKLIDKVVELQRKLLAAEGRSPEELQLRLAQLEQQLEQKNRALFGPSSEKRLASEEPSSEPDAQGEDSAMQADPKGPPPRKDGKSKRPGHGPRLQPSLPIEEVPHRFDAPDCICPKCGDPLKTWPGQSETSDQVDVIERRFVLRRHVREKRRCECGHIETALGPDKLAPQSRYSIDFAIHVAIGKYLEHLPLERQVRSMARDGLIIDSTTLFDQLWLLTRHLLPVYQALHAHVLRSPVVVADESRWPLFSAKGSELPPPSRWYIWAVLGTDAVYYEVFDTRGKPAAQKLLKDYRGTVVADGYAVYDSLAKHTPDVIRAACWTHQRRDFVKIESFFPTECKQILNLIGKLYALEREIPSGPEGDEARRIVRDTQSRAVLKDIQHWCLQTKVIPGSALEDAIQGMAKRWRALTRFLDDPRIPLDSNAVERALRGPVVGRKNHYGSRSRRGLEVSAILYSLLESAKLVGVDPRDYLRHAVLGSLRGEGVLLPHQFRDRLEAERRQRPQLSLDEPPAK